jgi:hypothetical protein
MSISPGIDSLLYDKPGEVMGVLARFEDPAELVAAAEKVRDAGYERFDCHSPFPIHGMDQAMGLPKSKVGWFAAVGGLLGGLSLFLLQWWVHAFAYPIVFSGKPLFAPVAYIVVAFEITIMGACFGALGGMFFMNQMPRYHHPVFYSDAFSRFSDDGFFVSIEAGDPNFDCKKVEEFLQRIGGADVEIVRADDQGCCG